MEDGSPANRTRVADGRGRGLDAPLRACEAGALGLNDGCPEFESMHFFPEMHGVDLLAPRVRLAT